jgi:hypothetical protein
MAEIVASLVWGLMELVLAFTGKFVVWVVSLGRWRSESLREDESRVFGAAGALSFVRDGQRVVTTTGLCFAGVAFYVLLFVLSLAYAASA